MKNWLSSFLSLFFPACCVICGRVLDTDETCICIGCNLNLPRTNYHLRTDNPVEQLFWGKISIEKASSFFFYSRGSDAKDIVYPLKYRGQHRIGRQMGRMIADELLSGGFFNGIDMIIPVPLHRRKQRKRGYNQSELIAGGIAELTGIPVDAHSVLREKDTDTQTDKSAFLRWKNVEGVFALRQPEKFANRHILIVDDVLTTGATIIACAAAFSKTAGVKVSVLTLAVAKG